MVPAALRWDPRVMRIAISLALLVAFLVRDGQERRSLLLVPRNVLRRYPAWRVHQFGNVADDQSPANSLLQRAVQDAVNQFDTGR